MKPILQYYFRSIDHRGPRRIGKCSMRGCSEPAAWLWFKPHSILFVCAGHKPQEAS